MKDNELTKKIEKMLHDQFIHHDAAWCEMASIVQGMVEDDMPKWISTKDKLPVEEGQVLIQFGDPFMGEFSQEIETGYYEDGEWRFWLNDRVVSTNGVTFWRPLPKKKKVK